MSQGKELWKNGAHSMWLEHKVHVREGSRGGCEWQEVTWEEQEISWYGDNVSKWLILFVDCFGPPVVTHSSFIDSSRGSCVSLQPATLLAAW